ncbi:MAG: DUF2934 domain-containing protein [Gammaproteobacteria bacterium]
MENDDLLKKAYHQGSIIDPETERAMIAERAYFKAQKRNFAPGHELDDWLEAEMEIKNQSFYWTQG